MTVPTIDQIEAALPYVPAGLHCGDLTEPDERREFAEVIHGIVVRATPAQLPPPKPDMSIAWGITEALIEDRGQ